MSLRLSTLSVLALAGAVAAFVHAGPSTPARDLALDRTGPDLLSNLDPESLRSAIPGIPGLPPVTVAQVGDADSFGRPVRWLGVTQGNVTVSADCNAVVPVSNTGCSQRNADPAVPTSFVFEDLARLEFPRGATESLLCHWFSPLLQLAWTNPGGAEVTGQLRYTPSLTVESPVLNNPALINPQTGLPFGGSLRTGMSAAELINTPLRAGESQIGTSRDTATCIAGFLTRRSLVESYGLTEVQARQVFRNRLTIRLNVSGNYRNLEAASLIFGLRVTGD